MKAKLVALIVIFVTNFRVCQSKRYDNFTLFSVMPVDVDHISILQNLDKQKYIDMVFWQKPVKLFYEVLFVVSPVDRDLFLERAQHYRLQYRILNSNIQSSFDSQTIRRYLRFRVETFGWDYYHTLEDIYQWLSDLALKYPNIVELYTIGKSAEGREIFAIGIKRNSKETLSPAVIIEGGIHGNEYISTEFVTYLASQLIHSNESTNWSLFNLARAYDWYLIPVLNPDGYAYSLKEDRLWKKNMRIVQSNLGVNLNRNFDYSFGNFDSSFDAKDETYCGPSAFSEPETQALSKFISQKKARLKFYFAFHGYGQKIVIPYADRINHVGDYSEMENYGKQAIIAMYRSYGTKYSVGTFYDTLGFRISGNSASWVKKTYKVKYVYTIMLRDNGTFGFALPPSQILPTCKETVNGLIQIMTAKPRRLRANLFASAAYFGGTKWLLCVTLLIMK